MDDLAKYLKKAQALNSKLELCREKIDQFNMEETAFEWELTSYPLMQATVDKLNPFLGLYETSMEFMNKQKTWSADLYVPNLICIPILSQISLIMFFFLTHFCKMTKKLII